MNRTELMTKARASADRLLQEKGYISVVEVLLAMGRLSKENLDPKGRLAGPAKAHLGAQYRDSALSKARFDCNRRGHAGRLSPERKPTGLGCGRSRADSAGKITSPSKFRCPPAGVSFVVSVCAGAFARATKLN